MKSSLITIYPAGDFGWEIVVTDTDGIEEGDAIWCSTKGEALKEGRKRFNEELTVKALVVLNREHFEIDAGNLIAANDKRIVRHR
jgi:hypothetical protein